MKMKSKTPHFFPEPPDPDDEEPDPEDPEPPLLEEEGV